jgi:hypothetical protein
MLKILTNIDPSKASMTSIISALTGQITALINPSALEMVNTGFQHLAWIIAIIAGLVSIINGTRKWFKK